MARKARVPATMENAIKAISEAQVLGVGDPVTNDQLSKLDKYRGIEERTKHHRTIITVWKLQQDQDRETRKRYANWLMGLMTIQVAAINLIFVLMGAGLLKFEEWTANVFVGSTFAQISAMVLLIVKYLFPASNDRILDLIDRFNQKKNQEADDSSK
jgi:hypothetical protein